jgi:hypothetical protein
VVNHRLTGFLSHCHEPAELADPAPATDVFGFVTRLGGPPRATAGKGFARFDDLDYFDPVAG